MRAWLARCGPAWLAALLLVAISPSGVGAHANYERSDPPSNAILDVAPSAIKVWFTEAPELRFSELQVYDANRRRVDTDTVEPVPGESRALGIGIGDELVPGTYTVMWKTLSAVDGHTARGAFPFTVGIDQLPAPMVLPAGGLSAATAPRPWGVVSRWLNLLAAVVLVGAFLFLPLVLGRALRATATDGATGLTGAQAWEAGRRRGLQVATFAAALGLTGGVLALLVQAAIAADVEPWQALGAPLATMLGTRYGLIWAVRMLTLAILGGLATYWQRPGVRIGRGGWAIAAGLGAVLLLTSSLNSHAAAIQHGPAVAVALDWAHLMATTIWIGGLTQLGLALPAALGAMPPAPRGRLLAAIIPRFSAWAMGSVGILAITGLYQTWLQVGSWDALSSTPYGQTLMAKVALLLPLLTLAGLNLLVLSPAVSGAVTRGTRAALDRLGGLQQRFRQSVGLELALGALVLAVVGLLTSLEPARDALRAQGVTRPVQVESMQAVLRVAPGEPGLNSFDVELTDGGRPVSDAQRVMLRVSHREHDMGVVEQRLEPVSDGHYAAVSGAFSMSGRWNVVLIVRMPGRDDVRGQLEFATVDATVALAQSGAPSIAAGPPTRLVVGSVLVALGGLLLIEAVRPSRRRRGKTAGVTLGCVAVFVGLALATVAVLVPASGDAVIPNPVVATTQSVSRGQELYQQSCVMCHGLNGRGDGPLAATLNPRPADLRIHVSQHTEGQLWLWITDGFPGSAMPAFRSSLSDEDRWNVVNYLRDRFGTTASVPSGALPQP